MRSNPSPSRKLHAPQRWARSLALILSTLLGSCLGEDQPRPGVSVTPIVGGSIESGFPLVGALAVDLPGSGPEAFCTATAVTPTVLLTAAHCLDAFEDLFGYSIVFHQTFEDSGEALTSIEVESLVNHPEWTGHIGGGTYSDIGVVRLEEPIDGSLFPLLNSSDLSARDIGTRLLAVGFGITADDANDAGIKRSVEVEVTRILSRAFGIEGHPDQWWGTCNGDSGGPAFFLEEERAVQWGVHVRGSAWVCGPGEETAVGAFFDDFLVDTILSLDPTAQECGDGLCTGIEETEDCLVDCVGSVCGDGLTVPPEACDDGNRTDGDGCSADCSSDESCGNAIVDDASGEICDDGNATDGDGCSADCVSDETCGNGILDGAASEICDDGNATDGDGCSADCSSDESCGNGILDDAASEMCDDGNRTDGDGCSADCSSDESCGNGNVDEAAGEACDDGNDIDDDLCKNDCTLPEEPSYEAGGGDGCDCGAAPRPEQRMTVSWLVSLFD